MCTLYAVKSHMQTTFAIFSSHVHVFGPYMTPADTMTLLRI